MVNEMQKKITSQLERISLFADVVGGCANNAFEDFKSIFQAVGNKTNLLRLLLTLNA